MTTFREEALAVPYRVEIHLPCSELKEELDKYWEKNHKAIIAHYKPQVKKAKGGEIPQDKARKMIEKNVPVQQLYQSALAIKLVDVVEKEGREVFHIDALSLYDYSDGGDEAILVGRVYYWPEMKLKEGSELKFEAKIPFKPDFEKAWNGRKIELWHKHRIVSEIEVEEGKVQDNHDLLVDIIASCDGAPYEKGTSRGTWFELRTLNPDIRKACLEHNVGDLFETSFQMTSMDKDVEGKKVDATIKIFKAREITYREVDDSIAKEEGFESLEVLREEFKKSYENYCFDIKKGIALECVTNAIMASSDLPAIPDSWLDRNAQRLIDNHVAKFKGDLAKAKAVVGAKDDEQFGRLFQNEIIRDILHKLAVRLYMGLYDLKGADDETLYEDMVNRVYWKE